MLFPMAWPRRRSFLLLMTATLVVLADFFFYDHPLGWPLAVVVGIAAAAVTWRNPALWRSMAGRISLAMVGAILLALVEEPSPLAILMTILCLGNLVLVARGGWSRTISGSLVRWVEMAVMLPLQWIADQRAVRRWFRFRPEARPAHVRWMLRWVVPLMAGSVFVLLFIAANPVIERWASEAWREIAAITDWLPEFLRPRRIMLWLVTGGISYGLLRYRGARARDAAPQSPEYGLPPKSTAHLLIIRCLIVFNLVFAVESVLDVYYLFGGATLPAGMTYTQYAHRGAYPLVFTALLAGLFVLATFRRRGAASRSQLARQLVYLWLGQNILLMISTIWRLWLYVDAFQLTRLRLATIIWLGLVGTGFGFLIWKIVAGKSNAWLWRVNVVNLLATLYVCAFINFSGAIAEFNVRHCREMGGRGAPIDVNYLAALGPAALPSMVEIRPHVDLAKRAYLEREKARLSDELEKVMTDWRGWTWRRERVARALQVEAVVGGRTGPQISQIDTDDDGGRLATNEHQ